MLLKHAIFTSTLLVGCEALANPPFTFSDNTPAEAAEVNANFDHLDQRLDALEDTSIPVVNVDCTGDPSALQAAIEARPHGRQTINFEGQCGPVRIRGMHDVILQGVNGAAGPAGIVNAGTAPHAVSVYDSTGVFVNDADVLGTAGLTTIRIYYSRVVLDNVEVSGSGNAPNLRIDRNSDVVLQDVNIGDGTDLSGVYASDNCSLELRGYNDLRATFGYSLWITDQSVLTQQNAPGAFLASQGAISVSNSRAYLLAGELTNSGGFSNYTLGAFNSSQLTLQTRQSDSISVEGDIRFISSDVSVDAISAPITLDSGEIEIINSRFFTNDNSASDSNDVAIYSTPFKTFRSEVSLGLDSAPDLDAIEWEFGDFTHFGIKTADLISGNNISCGEVVIARRTFGAEVRFCPAP